MPIFLKERAEQILGRLGISPSSATQMFYSQIVLAKSLPLNLHLPGVKPTAIGGMSHAELDEELKEGLDSLDSGSYTAEEVDTLLAKKFAIERIGVLPYLFSKGQVDTVSVNTSYIIPALIFYRHSNEMPHCTHSSYKIQRSCHRSTACTFL